MLKGQGARLLTLSGAGLSAAVAASQVTLAGFGNLHLGLSIVAFCLAVVAALVAIILEWLLGGPDMVPPHVDPAKATSEKDYYRRVREIEAARRAKRRPRGRWFGLALVLTLVVLGALASTFWPLVKLLIVAAVIGAMFFLWKQDEDWLEPAHDGAASASLLLSLVAIVVPLLSMASASAPDAAGEAWATLSAQPSGGDNELVAEVERALRDRSEVEAERLRDRLRRAGGLLCEPGQPSRLEIAVSTGGRDAAGPVDPGDPAHGPIVGPAPPGPIAGPPPGRGCPPCPQRPRRPPRPGPRCLPAS